MSSLLVKNGHIIDPASHFDQSADLLIEDGKVARIQKGMDSPAGHVLDATGLVVAPGFIDIHVHLREPGREDEETIESGSQAAAAISEIRRRQSATKYLRRSHQPGGERCYSDRRPEQECAGNGDALLLPTGKVDAALLYAGIVPIG